MTNTERIFTHFGQIDDSIMPREGIFSTSMSPGLYSYSHNVREDIPILKQVGVVADKLLNLSSQVTTKIINEIDKFCEPNTKVKFNELGLVYKRGFLLYGLPGTGKTALVMQIAESFIKLGGIVLNVKGDDDIQDLGKDIKKIRQVQKDLPVMLILEEIDEAISYCETDILSLLDGEEQVENFICLATTNYIDKIPSRIKCRPGRFASVVCVSLPDEVTRRTYIQSKFPGKLPVAELAYWVQATNGLTIDDIRECIIGVYCYDSKLDEIIDQLQASHLKDK